MTEFRTATLTIERTFTKPAAEVFEQLTNGIMNWWPKSFYIGTYDGIEPVGITFEPRAGAHLLEDWGDGAGLVWATSTVVHPPHKIVTVGDSSAQWGGPSRAFTEYAFTATDGGCKLVMKHEPYGAVKDATLKSLDEGWNELMDCLHNWVEKGEHPERPESVLKNLA